MKLIRVSLLLLVISILVVTVAQSQAPPDPAVQSQAPQCQAPSQPAAEALPSGDAPLAASAGQGGKPENPGKPGQTSTVTATGNSGPTDCEWYYIECTNGEDDLCCGSSSSCMSYCEELCGGECEEGEN